MRQRARGLQLMRHGTLQQELVEYPMREDRLWAYVVVGDGSSNTKTRVSRMAAYAVVGDGSSNTKTRVSRMAAYAVVEPD